MELFLYIPSSFFLIVFGAYSLFMVQKALTHALRHHLYLQANVYRVQLDIYILSGDGILDLVFNRTERLKVNLLFYE